MAVDDTSLPGQSGIASVLRVIYRDEASKVGNNVTGLYETWNDANYAQYQVGAPADASPIAEEGTDAWYKLTRPSWVKTPGTIQWKKVAGGTPSTDPEVASGPLDSGTITVQGGTPLPSTRRLYFRLKVAGVYTDPTGSVVTLRDPTQTFGVKRQDTGAVVVGVSPLQTYVRESVGSYYYEIAETGLALLYGAEYIDPSTATVVRQLLLSTAPPAQAHYATEADVDLELGKDNADIWADLENSLDATEIAAKLEDSLRQADNRVNRRLAAYSPPPAAFPVVSTVAWVTDDIRTAATKYAAGILLNKRDRQSRAGTAATDASPGDRLIADGDAILQGVIDAGMLGIALEPEDDTPAPGSFEFVPINRDICTTTGDENARPLLWY